MSSRAARPWACLILGFTLLPCLSSAELVVIYDSGRTRPIAPLLEALDEGPPPVDRSLPASAQLGAGEVTSLLPIRSPGLSPGPVARTPLDRPFARPFFLIGSDLLSRRWLARHRDRLLEIGAVGMLVEAETVDDLRAIAVLARGLLIMPAPADDIGTALGLSHYPVLVSRFGVEQ